MRQAGSIPTPSIVVRSGRGVWLLWLLVDDATGLPPRSMFLNLRLYRDIERAVQLRLAPLGADPRATDAVRMTRVPGSIHGGTGLPVRYDVQVGPSEQPLHYTLDYLATAFAIPRQAP